MDNRDYYTQLIYRRKHIDDDSAKKIAVKVPAWDLELDELLEMFHTIAIGASWMQSQFERALAEYLESNGWTVTKEEEDGTSDDWCKPFLNKQFHKAM